MRRLVLAVVLLAGCSDPSEPGADRICELPEPTCEIGATVCDGDTVLVCAPSQDRCGAWSPQQTCARAACSEGTCRVIACDPARDEQCNGRDDDCDGLVDEFLPNCEGTCTPACVAGATRCDMHGNIQSCQLRAGCLGWSEPRGCGGTMLCVGQRCVEARDCHDMDGDGAGVGSQCTQQDCNDREPLERPGGVELCDGLDNDCNGHVDDNPACAECDPGRCVPGTLDCVGRDVVACVWGPDRCGVLDAVTRCVEPQVCQDGACVEHVCADDRLEPNDAVDAARDVTRERLVGGQSCAGDDDWFLLATLDAGDWIEVEMRADGAAADLDLALWTEVEVARSARAGTNERVQWQAMAPTDVYALVQGYDGAEGGYVLEWTVTGPRDCDDDGLEPNDAHVVAALLTTESAFTATACPGDDDWYGPLEAPVGSTVMIQVTEGDFLGTLDATLVDPVGLTVVGRPLRGGVGLNFGYVAQEGQRVLLRVRGADVTSFGSYGVRVVVAGPEACVVDAGEPNDRRALAGPVVDAAYVCTGDSDWYEVGDLAGGSRVTIDVQATGFDPELELYAGDRLVALGTFQGREELLSYRVPFGLRGPHWARVSAWGPWFGPYTLDVDVVGPAECIEDELEPDDAPEFATVLAEDEHVDAALCAGSNDWFRLGFLTREVEGDRLLVSVEHAGAPGDVTVRLFDGGVIAATGRAVPGGTLVDLNMPAGERLYTVQIEPGPETAASYTVSWHRVGPEPCEDDANEPNDSLAEATPIAAGTTMAGQTCGDSPDFFALTDPVVAGQRVRAVVRFQNAEGDIDVRLFLGDDNVAAGTSVTDDEEVVHTVPDGNELTYTVEVFGFQGAETDYEITVTIEDPE